MYTAGGSVGTSLASQDLPFEHRLLPLLAERSSFFQVLESFLTFFFRLHEVSSHQTLADLGSSAQHSSAVPCPALPCGAVPCCMLCCAYSFVICQVSIELPYQVLALLHTRFVRATFLNHKKCTPSYSSAAQRRAVPCPTMRCCAVLRCAFFLRQYRVSCEVPGTRHQYVRVYSSFCFLHSIVRSRSS